MMIPLFQFYPRAFDKKPPLSHASLRQSRVSFAKAAIQNFVLLQILFLGLFCYLFGSLYQQGTHIHNLEIVFVDYDQGIIGTAVRNAYKGLQSKGFPTLVERSSAEFPSPNQLEDAVCRTDYWGAVYINPGTSEKLRSAIAGGSAVYDQSDTFWFVWNEAVYPTVVDPAIAGSIETLSNAAQVAYISLNGTAALETIPAGNATAVSIFANPWIPTAINLQPTTQGSRAIYNTLIIVLILIQDFFYLGIINGLYTQLNIYAKLQPIRIMVVRDLLSCAFTMIGALFVTIAIWAFRAGWDLSGTQFVVNWLALWLFAHINFLTLDIFTIWAPPAYVPMCLITWVVLNVTSILLPFELSPGFYTWGYALPAHEVYVVLTNNWSNGCNPHLRYALPILFAYEIVGLLGAGIGVYRRSHLAILAQETQEEAFRRRVEAAIEIEQRHDERSQRRKSEALASPVPESVADIEKRDAESAKEDRKEIEETIEKQDELERMETRASAMARFGPTFQLPFKCESGVSQR